MTQDELSAITCYSADAPEILAVLTQNGITPNLMGSTPRVSVYTAQLSGAMKTYLTLKFPIIHIGVAKFVNGKM